MPQDIYSVPETGTQVNDTEVEILLETEEALTEEDQEWLQWLAMDTWIHETAIEDDYPWIARGC